MGGAIRLQTDANCATGIISSNTVVALPTTQAKGDEYFRESQYRAAWRPGCGSGRGIVIDNHRVAFVVCLFVSFFRMMFFCM